MPWRAAMSGALYGAHGFYLTRGGPRRHFRTSAHSGASWATAMSALAARVERSLGAPPDFAVVDVGAGGGELLGSLAAIAPSHWRLVGVDLAPRPARLAERVEWRSETPTGVIGLLIANELLDVVPLDIATLTDEGPRLIEVSVAGGESTGDALSGADLRWQERWWPMRDLGNRAEIGITRDVAWRDLTHQVERGVAVAIDYAAVPDRDCAGTLTGHRHGRQVAPVPDGSCDLTAHVLFDSLVEGDDLLVSQRDALHELGVSARPPVYSGDPTSYLAELSTSGDTTELIDPAGLGAFTWLIRSHGVDAPLKPQRPPS
jgi:SAM-dependent MidA family methyltransferase